MKLFILVSLIGAIACSQYIDVDWSRVKSMSNIPDVATSPSDNDQSWSQFVIGGREKESAQYPFHVAIISEKQNPSPLCSGSLISRQSVLTSATCIHGSSSSIVILGGHDITDANEMFQVRFSIPSSNYRIHHGYRREGRIVVNDIAVIRLTHSIAFFTPAINVVSLPTPNDFKNVFANTSAIIMGFGRYNANSMVNSYVGRYSPVSTIDNSVCARNVTGVNVLDEHICTNAGRLGSLCSGSLGSPLVIERNGQFVQIGVASFYPQNCIAQASGFTRVAFNSIYSWLMQNI